MCCTRAVRKVGYFRHNFFLSSPKCIFMYSLTHGTQIYWFRCMFLDKCDVENTRRFSCTVLDLSMQRFCGWVVFRGIAGINTVIIGAVRALCKNAP